MAAVMILVTLEITYLLAGDTQEFLGFLGYGDGTYLLHKANNQSYWHMHMRRIVRVAAARPCDYIELSDSIDPQASR